LDEVWDAGGGFSLAPTTNAVVVVFSVAIIIIVVAGC